MRGVGGGHTAAGKGGLARARAKGGTLPQARGGLQG